MKKAVFSVMLITVLAKILGFGREILLSYYFGASGISDAYLISQTIPGTIFQFVGTGLATCFIPVYMKAKSREGIHKANQFTNTILTVIFFFSTIVIGSVWIFTKPIILLFASGFTGETLQYSILFTRIGIFSLYFSSLIYIFNSYLQSNGKFAIVSLVAIPNNIAIMGAIVLGAELNILALPLGTLLAILLQVLVLWPSMKKQDYRIKLNCNFKDNYIKETIILMIPVVIGVSVNQINVLIDRTIASNLAVGGISALIYADSLIMFVQGVFSQSIATVYYPEITRFAEKQQKVKLVNALNEALTSMTYILLPIMAGCIILANEIVRILYGRGAFDDTAVSITGKALMFYGIGILGYGVREVLSRVFYAFQDTKTPMINAVIGMVLNIIMNLTFSRFWGVGGLALATSISSIITAVLLYWHLRGKMGEIFEYQQKIEYGKMIVATGIMSAFIWGIYNLMKTYLNQSFSLMAAILAGIFIYIAASVILRINIFFKIIKILKERVIK